MKTGPSKEGTRKRRRCRNSTSQKDPNDEEVELTHSEDEEEDSSEFSSPPREPSTTTNNISVMKVGNLVDPPNTVNKQLSIPSFESSTSCALPFRLPNNLFSLIHGSTVCTISQQFK